MLGLCGKKLRQRSRQDCQLLVVLSLVRDVIRHTAVHDRGWLVLHCGA